MTYKEIVREQMRIALTDPKVIALGVGTGDGDREVFGTMAGLRDKFPGQVLDMPTCENTLTGYCIGLALAGYRPILIHQRCDFALLSMDQLINHLALWNQTYEDSPPPAIIRMIVGRGWGNGSQHTKDLHSMLAHVPGLYVMMCGNTQDAHYCISGALRWRIPTVIFEYRHLFDREEKRDDDPSDAIEQNESNPEIRLLAVGGAYYPVSDAITILRKSGIKVVGSYFDSIHMEQTTLHYQDTIRTLIVDCGWGRCSFAEHLAYQIGNGAEVLTFPFRHCPADPAGEQDFYFTPESIANKAMDMLGYGQAEKITSTCGLRIVPSSPY